MPKTKTPAAAMSAMLISLDDAAGICSSEHEENEENEKMSPANDPRAWKASIYSYLPLNVTACVKPCK